MGHRECGEAAAALPDLQAAAGWVAEDPSGRRLVPHPRDELEAVLQAIEDDVRPLLLPRLCGEEGFCGKKVGGGYLHCSGRRRS